MSSRRGHTLTKADVPRVASEIEFQQQQQQQHDPDNNNNNNKFPEIVAKNTPEELYAAVVGCRRMFLSKSFTFMYSVCVDDNQVKSNSRFLFISYY